MTKNTFTSLALTLESVKSHESLTDDQLYVRLAAIYDSYILDQTVLHFATRSESLGPGYLIAYDWLSKRITIRLRGDTRLHDLGFDEVNDFGTAKYDNPATMGETLVGAFWDARIARRHLERMVANTYARLSPEDIDSFAQIVTVSEADVAAIVPLSLPESEIKGHFCTIIGNPYAQKDWGGEICDIYCNIQFRRRSVPAAFVLKGKAYANKLLRIADLGKNGDQLVRLFSLPAEVFIIQSSGPIDGTVYSHIHAHIAERLMTNQPAYYLVLDGIQTARLLRAYGKI